MTRSASDLHPPGWHSVTPRLFVSDAKALVDFLKRVFNAKGDYRSDVPSVLDIGDSKIMVNDAGIRPAGTAVLYVYVDDCDAAYARAIEAGATSLEKPAILPYGDRRAMIEDRWGNTWQIATYMGSR